VAPRHVRGDGHLASDDRSDEAEVVIVVVMGVSGAGKTTVGKALAEALGWPFVEGDELHPPANVDKMRRGEALDDADRAPWLEAVATKMRTMRDGVVACSALKAAYREKLRVRDDVRFALLDVPEPELRRRLTTRKGHYMPPSLLASQLATLERPIDAITVDATAPLGSVVEAIRSRLA
jgi:gluconokinase